MFILLTSVHNFGEKNAREIYPIADIVAVEENLEEGSSTIHVRDRGWSEVVESIEQIYSQLNKTDMNGIKTAIEMRQMQDQLRAERSRVVHIIRLIESALFADPFIDHFEYELGLSEKSLTDLEKDTLKSLNYHVEDFSMSDIATYQITWNAD